MVQSVEYSRGINSSYVMLAADKDYLSEMDSVEMFRYNAIPYFLKLSTQKKAGCRQFCYDITGKRSLDQYLEYKLLDDKLLISLIYCLDQACMQTENYMLTENDILLNPEMIFLESESDDILYCYLPGNQEDICRQFREFMEYILQHLDHKNEQAVQLAYGVYQRVAEEQAALHRVILDIRNGNLEIQNFKSLSRDQDIRSVQTISKAATETEGKGQISEINIKKQIGQQEESSKLKQKEAAKKQAADKLKKLIRKKLYTNNSRDLEEEPVFGEEAEEEAVISPTVCMAIETESIQNQFIYQGMDRTRDFKCMDGKMILGSNSAECDICIPLPMISRVHARIEVGPQGTFLEDMNSTNGTEINGELLKYRKKHLLKKGDIICLAGEKYSFY